MATLLGRLRPVLARYPAAGAFLRTLRDVHAQREPALTTPWGFTLAGDRAMATGAFEPRETQQIRALLESVDILVNAGANVGYYCCHALSLGKSVVAAEPLARNIHYLLRNIRANGWSHRAEVYPVALGARPDVLDLWGGGTGASLVPGWASAPADYITPVPVTTLDRIAAAAVSGRRALVLVDIEGAELMLLRGAPLLLRSEPRPQWVVEIQTTEHQPTGTTINPHYVETFEMFFSLGYRAFTFDRARVEVGREQVAAVACGRLRAATHNYLFL